MQRSELENGNSNAIGSLMTENHTLLKKLGVSCKELDHLVEVSLKEGALGAKLCGSGKGGNIVAICDEEIAEHIKICVAKIMDQPIALFRKLKKPREKLDVDLSQTRRFPDN